MELVMIVLNKTEYLTEILQRFVEADIRGATVIDSAGMGHLMADHVPTFSMFAEEEDEEAHSKTIFTVVRSEEIRKRVVSEVEDVMGDLSKKNSAIIFSLPVNFVKGVPFKLEGDK